MMYILYQRNCTQGCSKVVGIFNDKARAEELMNQYPAGLRWVCAVLVNRLFNAD